MKVQQLHALLGRIMDERPDLADYRIDPPGPDWKPRGFNLLLCGSLGYISLQFCRIEDEVHALHTYRPPTVGCWIPTIAFPEARTSEGPASEDQTEEPLPF